MASVYPAKVEAVIRKLINMAERNQLQVDRTDIDSIHKKVSQLIAESWLSDTQAGLEIKAAMLGNDSNRIKEVFKKYGADLERLGSLDVNVDWDSFFSSYQETAGQRTLSLPYPPRPIEVTDQQLMAWTTNEDPEITHPPYAYIPQCTV